MKRDGMSDYIFFFDTYAFLEIIAGNAKYKPYVEGLSITSIFNIAELSYVLARNKKVQDAQKYAREYEPFIVPTTANDVVQAMKLRTKHKGMSIPNAVGYTLADKHRVKFLTGDEDFKNLPNVEFVK
jgi:uncharacterized protein